MKLITTSGKITEHFDGSEFRCKGSCTCGKINIDEQFVQRMEKLHNMLSQLSCGCKAIYITSGYRCAKACQIIKGAFVGDMHNIGAAADFYAEDIKVIVTKDGENYVINDLVWENKNAQDETVATFTLSGDGDYVVTVNATDKSGNEMVPYTSEIITVDTTAPEIIEVSGSQTGAEGCLSVPGEYGVVTRPEVVTVKAQDRFGNEFTVSGYGP